MTQQMNSTNKTGKLVQMATVNALTVSDDLVAFMSDSRFNLI